MTGTRRRLGRLAIIAAVAFPLAVTSSVPSFADRTTKADVLNAKAKLDQINRELEVVVELYDQARVVLQQTQQQLDSAKARMARAQAIADAARAELGQRAAEAYTGIGSQLDVLLGAQNFTEFSDRLEFMGALAQSDADLATKADTARQEADWARQRFAALAADQTAKLAAVEGKRAEIQGLLDQAETYYAKTNADFQAVLDAQRAAVLAQQEEDNGGGGGGDGGGTTTIYDPPPPDVSGAARAIDAAKQVIGTSYVFGAADPSVGFDCSGLTSWAWAQAGVSLPHSSAMQYAVLPHVALDQIQPGDLLFFFSPISHVALYEGGGMMIHARHPGPGGEVQETTIGAYAQPVGAARP